MTDASPARQFLLEPGSLGSLKELREADSGLTFKSCLAEFRRLVSSGQDIDVASQRMLEWFARRADGVAFAGEGSARMAFVTQAGRCLKLAKDYDGVDQNRKEISILAKKPGFAVRMFDFDRAQDPIALETEACEKATARDAEAAVRDAGLSCSRASAVGRFIDLVDALLEFGRAGMDAARAAAAVVRQADRGFTVFGWASPREVENALAAVMWGNSAQCKAFRELVEFYAADRRKVDSGEKDLISMSDTQFDNFGVVVRGSERVFVFLDAGL